MAVRFTIGRDVHELGVGARFVESFLESGNELLPGGEQPLERDFA